MDRTSLLRLRSRGAAAALLLAGLWPASAAGQIVTDGTLGPPGQALAGDDYQITAELGAQHGPNLFHSFSVFDLYQNQSATFSGPGNVENVISRVTGGSRSWIDGRLASTIDGADLFFLNPWGIHFGPHASLDVSGSFHASTADVLFLGEEGRFDARTPGESLLTVEAPSAFGFLSENPASIHISGAGLGVPPGETLSLIGGAVDVVGGLAGDGAVSPVLAAQAGQVGLVSVGSSGTVEIDPSNPSASPQLEGFAALGDMHIAEGARLDTSSIAGGGRILLRGGRIVIEDAALFSDAHGDADGAEVGIDVAASEELRVTGSWITTDGFGAGDVGDVLLDARDVVIEANSVVRSAATDGDGGDVVVTASESVAVTGLSSVASYSSGIGKGGGIAIKASESVAVTGLSNITSVSSGGGKGGDVSISAGESVRVAGEFYLDSPFGFTRFQSLIGTHTQGLGNGGALSIWTPFLSVDSGGRIYTETTGSGMGGGLLLDVESLSVTGGGVVETTTSGFGPGGALFSNSSDWALVSGGSYFFDIFGGQPHVFPSRLSSETTGPGTGGDLRVATPWLVVEEGAEIQTAATEASIAPGGALVLDVGTLWVDGGAHIGTHSSGFGNGGNVVITASESVAVTGLSSILSSSSGVGRGGDVFISAGESLRVADEFYRDWPFGFTRFQSQIGTHTQGLGNGGALSIWAPSLSVEDGGVIYTETIGSGRGGSLLLDIGLLSVTGGGVVETTTLGSGSGGLLFAAASDRALVSGDSSHLSGGQPYFFPSRLASETTGAGTGGDLHVATPRLFVEERAEIQTSGTETSTAPGGALVLDVGSLSVGGGANIGTSNLGSGAGGPLLVSATDSVNVVGFGTNDLASQLYSTASGDGDAGGISIDTPELHLENQGALVAITRGGVGRAADIELNVGSLAVDDGEIKASTLGEGHGGNIRVDATEFVRLSGLGYAIPLHYGIISAAEGQEENAGNAGDIHIIAPELMIDSGAVIDSSTQGGGAGGNITLEVETLEMTGGAAIGAVSAGSGRGGLIDVEATKAISLSGAGSRGNATIISTIAHEEGAAGSIALRSPEIDLDGGMVTASTFSKAVGGNITLEVENLEMTGGAVVAAASGGQGAAGVIEVEATEAISLSGAYPDGTPTAISSIAKGKGAAGSIALRSPEIDLDGATILSGTEGPGRAGNITVRVGTLKMTNGGWIDSSTYAAGAGGLIDVEATEAISLSGAGPDGWPTRVTSETKGEGDAGSIALRSPELDLDGGFISSLTEDSGGAGRITIRAGTLEMTNGAIIDSSTYAAGAGGLVDVEAAQAISLSGAGIGAFTLGEGDAGRIALRSPEIDIDGGLILGHTRGSGRAGSIDLDVDRLVVRGSGIVSSGTYDVGAGGSVTVRSNDSVLLTGHDNDDVFSSLATIAHEGSSGDAGSILVEAPQVVITDGAGITATTEGLGRGGDITLEVENLEMTGGAEISAKSMGPADAGRISIRAGDGIRMIDSTITAEALQAFGGSIVIEADRMLHMTQSEISTTVGSGSGDGGNISIDPDFVILDASRIVAQADAGSGGNISIVADVFLASPDSVIDASSNFGIEGTVTVNAPDANLAGTLAALPESFLDAAALMRERCAARRSGTSGSFVVSGRDGVPVTPDGPIPATVPLEPASGGDGRAGVVIAPGEDGRLVALVLRCGD